MKLLKIRTLSGRCAWVAWCVLSCAMASGSELKIPSSWIHKPEKRTSHIRLLEEAAASPIEESTPSEEIPPAEEIDPGIGQTVEEEVTTDGTWEEQPHHSCFERDYGCKRCCGKCGSLPANCESGCRRFAFAGFTGFDSFKGVADDDWSSNFGLVTGLNGGAAVPLLSRLGVGAQLGASYGFYDFQGRSSGDEPTRSQDQVFITMGLFRRATANFPLSGGFVYDMMINDNFGVRANEPFLRQFRGQVGFAVSARNELGWTGMLHDGRDTQNGIAFRSINQINWFWHHKFDMGADSWFWMGIPEQDRLLNGTSLGEWIFGGSFTMPLTNRVGAYANFQYMKPSARAGFAGAIEDFYQIGVGLTWYPGGGARTRTVGGRCWMPYLPVANNATFMVDDSAPVGYPGAP